MRPYGCPSKAQAATFRATVRPRRRYLETMFRRAKKVSRRSAKQEIREETATMFIAFMQPPPPSQEAPPEPPSLATLPPPPHDGTGAPVDEPQPTPPPRYENFIGGEWVGELVKALDSSPTTDEEARRNAALAKSQRIDTAARAIAEALKGLDDSEALGDEATLVADLKQSLEAVYMGNKRARGGL